MTDSAAGEWDIDCFVDGVAEGWIPNSRRPGAIQKARDLPTTTPE